MKIQSANPSPNSASWVYLCASVHIGHRECGNAPTVEERDLVAFPTHFGRLCRISLRHGNPEIKNRTLGGLWVWPCAVRVCQHERCDRTRNGRGYAHVAWRRALRRATATGQSCISGLARAASSARVAHLARSRQFAIVA